MWPTTKTQPSKPAGIPAKAIVAALIIALVVLAVTWHRRNHFRHIAETQHRLCKECYSDALAVLKLQTAPRKATRNIVDINTIAQVLENSAQKAGVAPNAVSRIYPSRPRTIPQSDYVECQTRISLRNLQLSQLSELLWNITNELPGLNVSELHVWVEPDRPGLWQAEFTLAGISLAS